MESLCFYLHWKLLSFYPAVSSPFPAVSSPVAASFPASVIPFSVF